MSGKPRRVALWTLCLCVFATLASAVALAPRDAQAHAQRPHDDDLLLANVPARNSVEGRQREALRAQQRSAPRDEQAALRLVRAHIEHARREGDPRPLGLAEAVLKPFLSASASAPVLVAWATIEQSRHHFQAALQTLERARKQAPHDPQALLTEATVLTVLGRFHDAATRCALLREETTPLYAELCAVPIAMMTGHASDALATLQRARTQTSEASELAWISSLECETRYWQSELAAAERACQAALSLDANDRYTRALYADVLLDLQENARVLPLVANHALDDALVLRAVLARLPEAEQSAELTSLRAGFERDRARGEAPHGREEARLLLALGENERALAHAKANFAVQREPWDVRLLLEAALRMRDKSAAQPAVKLMNESGFAAPRVRSLAKQIEELP